MNREEVIERFRRTGALLEGHFVLTSGLHSTQYLQCALVLQHPAEAEAFGRAIAEQFREVGVETVAAPAIGGIIIGWEVARALNVRSIWTEREDGRMTSAPRLHRPARRARPRRRGRDNDGRLDARDVRRPARGGRARRRRRLDHRPLRRALRRGRPAHRPRHARSPRRLARRLPPLRRGRPGRQTRQQETVE